MYSVNSYGKMIADTPRMEAYVSALRRAVTPESVVLDLGSGPALFGLLACQMGARRVYAVEPDNVIQLAREAAIANGFADRIICLQDFSTHLDLPERVDVIISDLRGVLPWFQRHLPSVCDARNRFLAEGGVLIPQRDTLWMALVEAPDKYQDLVGPWQDNPYHLELTHAQLSVTNTWQKSRVTPNQLLVEPACWQVLDYKELGTWNVKAEVVWTMTRTGIAHGLAVWFDSELADGIGLTNRPGAPELIYGNAFFPFLHPIELESSDEVKVTISAHLVNEDYIWRWDTRVINGSSPNEVKADFKQSTFFGAPLSPSQLAKRSASYVPVLNDDGEVETFILSLMDGKTSLEKVADQLKHRFPDKFPDSNKALTLAGEISLKYSK
jgi:type I protein arginine methyltransferase